MLTLPVAFFAVLLYAASIGKAFRAKSWLEVSSRLAADPLGSPVLAVAVPIAEVAAASLLLFAPLLGSLLVALLMLGFAGGACALKSRLSGVPCGCFGELSRSTFGPALCRCNAALALLACALAAAAPRRSVLDWDTRDWRLVLLALAAWPSILVLRRYGVELRRAKDARAPTSSDTLIPRELLGKPWLGVFVAAHCPACRAAFETVGAEARRSGPPIVVIPLGDNVGAKDFPPALELILRADLAHLAQAWHVPGTPFAVLVSADGRILASGPATSSGDIGHIRSTKSNVTDTRVNRREAISLGARAYAGMYIALHTFFLTLGTASGAHSSRSSGKGRDLTITHRSLNRITDSCSKFKEHALKEGVVIDENPVKYDQGNGYEYGATVGPDSIEVAVCDYQFFNAGFFWSGYCPCDKNQTSYDNPSLCKADCPSYGLECFGQQCQTTRNEYCAELRFTICVQVSGWTVNTLEWAPAKAECARNADRVNTRILAHELGHVSDDRDVASKIRKEFKLKKCGRSQREVLQQLKTEMEQIRAANENAFKSKFMSDHLLRRARRHEHNTQVTCDTAGC
jgi:hypothetical protein